jgi:hypothetical protein
MAVHLTQKAPLKQRWREELLALLLLIGVVLAGILGMILSFLLTWQH